MGVSLVADVVDAAEAISCVRADLRVVRPGAMA